MTEHLATFIDEELPPGSYEAVRREGAVDRFVAAARVHLDHYPDDVAKMSDEWRGRWAKLTGGAGQLGATPGAATRT